MSVEAENETTVVIQGPFREYTNKVIRSYIKLPFIKKIIVSHWEDDDLCSSLDKDLSEVKNIEFISNKKPFSSGTDNRNLQIVSSASGIKKVESKISIKVRSDQIFSRDSLIRMNEYYVKNKNNFKLFVFGIYPSLLFHPNDHLVWGETQELLKMFDIPLETNGFTDKFEIEKYDLCRYYRYFIRTETYLGAHYLANYHSEINSMLSNPEEFLHDESPSWNQAHFLSNTVTKKYFKSFPRKNIKMFWVGKNIYYPFDEQKAIYNHCWCEDGC